MAEVGPHLLGRVPSPYDRRDYHVTAYLASQASDDWLDKPIRALIGKPWRFMYEIWRLIKSHADDTPTSDVEWVDNQQLDQGNTGHCVGFGHAQFGNSLPIEDHYTDADGHDIYYEAKSIELEHPVKHGDPDAEGGTYVRAGAKALQDRGRIKTYAFAYTTQHIIEALHKFGPVVVGTDWTDDMFYPDSRGAIRPTGSSAGGHCYLIVGYLTANWSEPVFKFQNSWGEGWGAGGYFYMTVADFATLLNAGGEAEVTVEAA